MTSMDIPVCWVGSKSSALLKKASLWKKRSAVTVCENPGQVDHQDQNSIISFPAPCAKRTYKKSTYT